MLEPRFEINERVMLISELDPLLNVDSTFVMNRVYEENATLVTGETRSGWFYVVARYPNVEFHESALRKITKDDDDKKDLNEKVQWEDCIWQPTGIKNNNAL